MINSISSIQGVGSGSVAKPAALPPAETAAGRPVVEAKAADIKTADAKTTDVHLQETKATDEPAAKPTEAAKAAAERSKLPIREMSDIQLKYRVNPDTKELTVMVVDKASHKVIRTIPAEEIKNLNAGDLIQLTS
jgi:uncharacterized FlaG/YvyC family protein